MSAYNVRAYGGAAYVSLGSGFIEEVIPPATYAEEVVADSPVRYYRMKEASGTVGIDEMGVANGTYSGTGYTLNQAGFTPDGKSVLFNAAAAPGGKMSMNLTADYVGTFTIECMINLASSGHDTYGYIISKVQYFASATTKFPVSLRYNPATQKVEFSLNDGTTYTPSKVLYSAVLAHSTDYHIVARYAGNGTCTLHINGVLADSQAITFAINADASLAWLISTPLENGGGVNNATFAGRIAEVAIYSNYLSLGRIAAHYAAIGIAP